MLEQESSVKSIRLTNQIRDDIVNNIMESWKNNNPQPDNIISDEECAEFFYNLTHSKDVQEDLERISKSYGLRYRISSMFVCNKSDNDYKRFYFKGEKLSCQKFDAYTYDEPDETKNIFTLYDKSLDLMKEYNTKKGAFKRQVSAIIYSVNTTKQLSEIWPEVVEFIPMNISNPSKGINLPATLKDELNSQFLSK